MSFRGIIFRCACSLASSSAGVLASLPAPPSWGPAWAGRELEVYNKIRSLGEFMTSSQDSLP